MAETVSTLTLGSQAADEIASWADPKGAPESIHYSKNQ